MEDDKIKDLFAAFTPELTSDTGFMRRLERNMEAVEIVKRRNAEVRRSNRRAVVLAALTGFVCGVVLTLLMPFISPLIVSAAGALRLPFIDAEAISSVANIVCWIIVGAAAVAASLSTYESAMSVAARRSLKVR